jgi:hypothetical protein
MKLCSFSVPCEDSNAVCREGCTDAKCRAVGDMSRRSVALAPIGPNLASPVAIWPCPPRLFLICMIRHLSTSPSASKII